MSLKILQYNVNKSRDKVLAGLLEDPRRHDFDIIAVQEPWRNPYDSSAYCPRASGFYLVDIKNTASRISFYVNRRISADIWSETFHSPDLGTVTLRLEDGELVNIHNVYIPPPESHAVIDLESQAWIEQALGMPGNHVMIGDFNLHHPLWGGSTYPRQHRAAETLIQTMRTAGVELALPQGTITREARRGNSVERTTIDLVWLSIDLLPGLIQCRTADELEQSSDHLPITTWLQTGSAPETQPTRQRRAWAMMDNEKFDTIYRSEIEGLDNRQLQTREDIEEIVTDLTQAIHRAIDGSTPWSRPCSYSKPWWTPECQEVVHQTRRLRRVFTRTQTEEAWQEYLQAKNRKGKVIAKAKRTDFRERMRDAGEAQGALWHTARWARQRAEGKATQIAIPTLRQGTEEAPDPRSKAEMLKRTHFPPPVVAELSDIEDYRYPIEVEMSETLTDKEVTQVIQQTAKDKAPGTDWIPNRALHRVATVSPALLQRIFQRCLDLGVHPARWKEATTVMLRKPNKPDYTSPKAYRPIALLNTLGKALEAVMARRLRFLVEKYTLLPNAQMGARKGRSTETALYLLLEKVRTI